jgi:tetratricopeptide (TPR) repeat protein
MNQQRSSEGQWLHWIEIQRQATSTWLNGNLSEALALIDRYVESSPPIDLKRQAIGFRGSLHEEQGNLHAAKKDFLMARGLSGQPDFERCTLEESMASVSARLGDVREAEKWYWQAIETAASDPRAINGITLIHFLDIREPEGLSHMEQQVIEGVLSEAWKFHNLPGAPDLQDLRVSANQLIELRRSK